MPWVKAFDQHDVQDKAMRAFWQHGYEGTSLAELLDHMGIQKGSFYATFGSKHELFITTLRAYTEERFTQLEQMRNADSPRAALIEHFRLIAADALNPDHGPMGCYVANTAVECAPKNPDVQRFIQETFERHIGIYRDVLTIAKTKNELPSTLDALQTARTLLALLLGLRVLSRANMPKPVILAIRDHAIELIS